MLRCTVKFCGGCNPRYDRGKAYDAVRTSLSGHAVFEYPKEGVHYDALLIIRGCTGCEYRYEEIDAGRRFFLESEAGAPSVIDQIKLLASDKRGG